MFGHARLFKVPMSLLLFRRSTPEPGQLGPHTAHPIAPDRLGKAAGHTSTEYVARAYLSLPPAARAEISARTSSRYLLCPIGAGRKAETE